ncbi:type IV toxin-antitoxin system AbiEi family antitoxin domain-containing protein [Gordonia sp. OPL2]|uniref:DUF559 domain-containing protein n=1 Tax=Gordonia sp. OPL2 TaxID=2486274 RepID=UPI001654E7A0|nr:type IV toxin-antitoxin system AbiEi family antitoxin domain-containing protein [Gordonia sp. OPL2]RPA10323.1 DUF559 domain-containing protein [Gordonia sp. OPL2]
MIPAQKVRQFLATHDGVITMKAALEAGLSRAAVKRKVASGEWIREATGVYRAADHPRTVRARVRIAIASVGPNAILSGAIAAWWHGLTDRFPESITVASETKGHHRGAVAWVRIRHRTFEAADVVVVDGARVTSVALTVLDAASETGSSRLVDNALLRQQVTLVELAQVHARYPRRAGVAASQRLLAALESGARSEAERVTVALFTSDGIAGWVANTTVCDHLADFVFDEEKVIVEIDGFAFHRDAETFQRDRTKRNRWIAAGYVTLNFTWDDITTRPEGVAASVRTALTSRLPFGPVTGPNGNLDSERPSTRTEAAAS